MGNVKSAFQPDEVVKWGNDPKVLNYLATHDAKNIIDGDYVLPQSQWGVSQAARHASGIHMKDGGYENGLAYGKLDTHITASQESPLAPNGGKWDSVGARDRFTPSQSMLNQPWYGDAIREYFPKHEDESMIYNAPRLMRRGERLTSDEVYQAQMHEQKMLHDKEYKKQFIYSEFAKQDQPLRDTSMDMFLMAQGPKTVASYGHAVPTMISRAATAIREKDVTRLAGLPNKQELREALADTSKRDKVMWKITGNGVKANNVNSMQSNNQGR